MDFILDQYGNVFLDLKPRKKRKHKVIQALESKGYCIEKEGREWCVWHPKKQGVEAIYSRLKDIDINEPL